MGECAASHCFRSSTPSPVAAEIMNVASNFAFAPIACAVASRDGLSVRSTLFSTSTLGFAMSGSFARICSASSSTPFLASISSATMSASCAPPQAVVTIARSSRRRGAKMPGVSIRTSCASPTIATPRTMARVVCTLRETMETLEPTSALVSVDLPAFGAPISAMKPQRRSSSGGDGTRSRDQPFAFTPSRVSIAAAAACSAARLERPIPSAGASFGTSTATRNSGL